MCFISNPSGEVTLYAFVYADLQEANYRLTEG